MYIAKRKWYVVQQCHWCHWVETVPEPLMSSRVECRTWRCGCTTDHGHWSHIATQQGVFCILYCFTTMSKCSAHGHGDVGCWMLDSDVCSTRTNWWMDGWLVGWMNGWTRIYICCSAVLKSSNCGLCYNTMRIVINCFLNDHHIQIKLMYILRMSAITFLLTINVLM